MSDISISEGLDLAIAKLPFVRRMVWKTRLANKAFRKKVEAELAVKLLDDEDCCALVPAMSSIADSADFASMRFAIDPANLEKFLELIIKYLPLILDIISKLFALIPFIALSLLASNCTAQEMVRVCDGQTCRLVPKVANVVRAATATATSTARATVGAVAAIPSDARAIAQASATARALNQMQGHHPIDLSAGRRVGVGYSQTNPRPHTCYPFRRGEYSVVQGPDGYYSTKVLRR